MHVYMQAHLSLERTCAVAADKLFAQVIVLSHAQALKAGCLALCLLQKPAGRT
jgi:hypothetical protein